MGIDCYFSPAYFSPLLYILIMNLKRACLFLAVAFFIAGCGSDSDSIKSYLKHADGASIVFYNEANKSIQIMMSDKASVQKLASYITGEEISTPPCKETGSIWFYKNGSHQLLVDFSTHSVCRYFSYRMDHKSHIIMMSKDAAAYLDDIQKIASGSSF